MMKTLLELMDDELKKMEIYEIKGFSSVKEFITSDSKCKEFMKILLKYRERVKNFFAYNDKNNCQRVYERITKLCLEQ